MGIGHLGPQPRLVAKYARNAMVICWGQLQEGTLRTTCVKF